MRMFLKELNLRILLMSVVILFVVMICGFHHMSAQTKTSTGTGNWNSAGTWNPPGVPTSNSDVVITNGHSVTVDANAACKSLTMPTGNNNNTLTISGTNTLTVSGTVTLSTPQTGNTSNTLAIGSGTLNAQSISLSGSGNNKVSVLSLSTGTINISDNLAFSGDAATSQVLTFTGAGTVNIGGNLSANGTVTTVSGSTINFNGSGAQNIGPYTYANLKIDKTGGTATLTGNASVTGNLTIQNGSLSDGGYQLTKSAGPSGTMSMAAGTTLTLSSGIAASAFWPNFATITLDPTSTIIYGSNSTQTISSTPSYEHIKFSGTGHKWPNGNLTVNGNLNIESGSTFKSSNKSHTVKGNFTNNGTFNTDTSTVVLSGGSSQAIGGTSPTIFNSLEINNDFPVLMNASATTNSTLTLRKGSLSIGSNTLTINGDVSKFSGGLTGGASSNIYVGGSGTQLTLPAVELNDLTVNRANGLTLGGTVSSGNLNLIVGLFVVGAHNKVIKRPIQGTKTNLRANSSSRITISGNETGISLPSSITELGTLVIENNNGAALEGPLTIANDLTLSSGTLNTGSQTLSIATGAKITPSGGSLSSPPTYQGPVNLSYNGGSAVTIGNEFPANGVVAKLKVSGAGANLAANATITDTLEVGSGSALTIGNGKKLTAQGPISGNGKFQGGSGSELEIAGSGAQITLPEANLDNLTINRANGLVLGGPVTVNSNLNLQVGTVTVGVNALTIKRPIMGDRTKLQAGSTSTLKIAGTQSNIIVPSSVTQLGSLEVNNSSGLNLETGLTVYNTLRLDNGILKTNSNSLTLGTSPTSLGELNRTNGMIEGCFTRWFGTNVSTDMLYPIVELGRYVPVQLGFTTAPSAGGTITACFIPTNPGTTGLPLSDGGTSISKVALEGYWRITSSGLTGGVYEVFLTGTNFYGINDVASVRIIKRTNNTSPWTLQGTHSAGTGTSSNPTAKRVGLSGFSEFAFGGGDDNAMPVELHAFAASYRYGNIHLTWKTVTEANNYGFEIERSTDKQIWTNVGFVHGSGTANSPRDYEYTDVLPDEMRYSHAIFYRLRQIDREGKITPSPIVSVENAMLPLKPEIVEIHPNPIQTSATFSFFLPRQEIVTFVVYNNIGREVARLRQNESMSAGHHSIIFKGAELPNGVYHAVLKTSTGNRLQSFILNR